LVAPRRIFE
jgi:hypothetical protein